ncbi:MAG: hypothetical protein QM236_08605 [Bacillota bacterium]|jgi:hypothetical protein|nr:hypothetical protein [Bacillota bacterium]
MARKHLKKRASPKAERQTKDKTLIYRRKTMKTQMKSWTKHKGKNSKIPDMRS